ncbi:MAG: outer membrane protein assembly factor BamE [Verrucomicrobiales bacterium]|jgi:outer membrane protein assembly factor BamE (lipoprotein component of BamABCDE complex)|nr:outer membrane protein assembly factor BamE [Verrucomicrobiales bacterium]
MNKVVKKIGLLACVVVLAACSGKLTNDNLLKVKSGMSEAEVKAILGNPTKVETSETLGIRGSSYIYQKGKNKVQITFVNDVVIGKSGNFE